MNKKAFLLVAIILSLLLPFVFAANSTTISPHVVHEWRMNTSNQVYDFVGSAHQNAASNVVWNNEDMSDHYSRGYWEINGIDLAESYIETSTFVPPNLNFTVEFWIKINASTFAASNSRIWTTSTGADYYLYAQDNEGEGDKLQYGSKIGAGEIDMKSTAALNSDHWYQIMYWYNGSDNDWRMYIDGELNNTASESGNVDSTARSLEIGRLYSGSWLYEFEGQVGLMRWYDKALDTDEINFTYNNSKGACVVSCGEIAPPTITGHTDIIFKNETGTIKVLYAEGENFNAQVNYTLSNGTIPENGNCNLSIFGGIVEYESNPEHFSMCNTGCDFDTWDWSYNNTEQENNINNSIHFKACHIQNAVYDIELTVNCNNYGESISFDNADFVDCVDGFTTLVYPFSNCTNDTTINITLGNNAIPALAHNISDVELDREFDPDVMNLTWNSSSFTYVTEHNHEFYRHGEKTIGVNCSLPGLASANNHSFETITIVNVAPKISFVELQINQNNFSEINESGINKFVFLNGTYNFLVSVIDDDLANVTYTFYNNSGDIIRENSTNISHLLITDFDQQPYNFSILATDTTNSQTFKSILFNTTDPNTPLAFGIVNDTVVNGSTYQFNVTFIDENFFSYNVSCSNGFKSSKTGLNTNSYNFANTTIINGNVTCEWRYCDGHTKKELKKNWNVREKTDSIEIWLDSKNKVNLYCPDAKSFKTKRKLDRYSYTVDFNQAGWQTCYYETVNGHYLYDDKYMGWIVDSHLETWLDFNPYEANVFQYNQSYFEIEFYCDKKTCSFDSIGELNCKEITQRIEVTPEDLSRDVLPVLSCPRNSVDTTLWVAIIAVLIAIFILNHEYIRYPVVDMINGLGFILFGASAMGCSVFFGVIIIGLGVIVMGAALSWD